MLRIFRIFPIFQNNNLVLSLARVWLNFGVYFSHAPVYSTLLSWLDQMIEINRDIPHKLVDFLLNSLGRLLIITFKSVRESLRSLDPGTVLYLG